MGARTGVKLLLWSGAADVLCFPSSGLAMRAVLLEVLFLHAGLAGIRLHVEELDGHGALDESADCSGLLEHIEHQAKYPSDVSFDMVRASALAGGGRVVANRNLVSKDRCGLEIVSPSASLPG
ncbi:hypothetical protein NDU88_004943 [Pleurodeles waltl]|uniref:Uncharacterized protein n=1 Tax=Pleurodeles waltl TaxID=8319 RepID=A0AAV7TV62_PLEWA|nr:hypothetical protein NDU88_004943 [Pleurodeles waltl]